MPHMVFCTKYKAEMEGLDEPPFDSDFGQKAVSYTHLDVYKRQGRCRSASCRMVPIAGYARTAYPAPSSWYCTSRRMSASSSRTKIV